jgi:hypothetical protein
MLARVARVRREEQKAPILGVCHVDRWGEPFVRQPVKAARAGGLLPYPRDSGAPALHGMISRPSAATNRGMVLPRRIGKSPKSLGMRRKSIVERIVSLTW